MSRLNASPPRLRKRSVPRSIREADSAHSRHGLRSRKIYRQGCERLAQLDTNGVDGTAKTNVFPRVFSVQKTLLRGTIVAVYIAGQERRLVDPPSQVVAGVRTVTTKMDGRCDPHVAAPILFMTKRKTDCAFLFLHSNHFKI